MTLLKNIKAISLIPLVLMILSNAPAIYFLYPLFRDFSGSETCSPQAQLIQIDKLPPLVSSKEIE